MLGHKQTLQKHSTFVYALQPSKEPRLVLRTRFMQI